MCFIHRFLTLFLNFSLYVRGAHHRTHRRHEAHCSKHYGPPRHHVAREIQRIMTHVGKTCKKKCLSASRYGSASGDWPQGHIRIFPDSNHSISVNPAWKRKSHTPDAHPPLKIVVCTCCALIIYASRYPVSQKPKIFHNNLTTTAHLLMIFGREDCYSITY